jgi:uncharacterized protein DUF6894
VAYIAGTFAHENRDAHGPRNKQNPGTLSPITGQARSVGVRWAESPVALPPALGSTLMIRYYFDIRDNTRLYRDDEGLEFNTQREAEVEAAKSLANLAKDFASIGQDVSVEVRTDVERVFQAAFIFDRSRTKQ